DQHVEGDATVQRLGVGLRLSAVLRERIDDLGIAAALAIPRSRHCHRGEYWDAIGACPVEASRQEHRFSADPQQFVVGRGEAGAPGEAQGDLLPCLHAVVVGLLEEFRYCKATTLIYHRRLGPRTAKR